MQIDKTHFAHCGAAGQQLANCCFSAEQAKMAFSPFLAVLQHPLMQGVQPRSSVGVGQWDSGGHFPPIFLGVIVVGVFELPSRASGE